MQRQVDQALVALDKAVGEGARILYGGLADESGLARGYFMKPTVVGDVDAKSSLAQTELFAPVIALIPADNFEDALAKANDSRYGLSASFYGRDPDQRRRFVEEIEVGMVHLDEPTVGAYAHTPFGGWKETGIGPMEMAEGGVEFFTRPKTVSVGSPVGAGGLAASK